jgi:hypothetical protein
MWALRRSQRKRIRHQSRRKILAKISEWKMMRIVSMAVKKKKKNQKMVKKSKPGRKEKKMPEPRLKASVTPSPVKCKGKVGRLTASKTSKEKTPTKEDEELESPPEKTSASTPSREIWG